MSTTGLQYYLERMNPCMLTYARELRGLTKKDLAEQIGKTPATLTRIENGTLRPEYDTFFSLTRTLQVEPAFLARSKGDFPNLDISRVHFRGKRKVGAAQKKKLIREGEAAFDIVQFFERKGICFPDDILSDLATSVSSHYDIEKLALDARQALGLGFGPIKELVATLESAGIILLFVEAEDEYDVDAFSSVINKRMVVILNRHASVSRLFFSIAHEIGHLLMHEYTDGSMQQEKEANLFASAFLLPWKTFAADCPTRWNLSSFVALKQRWHVSIGAMLYRAKYLGIISQGAYVHALQRMRDMDIAVSEPAEPDFEPPALFSKATELLLDEGLNIEDLQLALGQSQTHSLDILSNQYVSDELLSRLGRSQGEKSRDVLAFRG